MSLYIFDAMLLRFSLNGNNPRYFSSPCGILNLSMKEDKTDANFLPISIYKNMIYILTAIGLTPCCSSTVQYCTHLHTSSTVHIYTHKQYSTVEYSTHLHTKGTVHIYTQRVEYSTVNIYKKTVQYSTHLHTKSTVHIYTQTVQYSTVHIYTQTVQYSTYSTHLHTNSKVHIYTQRVQ